MPACFGVSLNFFFLVSFSSVSLFSLCQPFFSSSNFLPPISFRPFPLSLFGSIAFLKDGFPCARRGLGEVLSFAVLAILMRLGRLPAIFLPLLLCSVSLIFYPVFLSLVYPRRALYINSRAEPYHFSVFFRIFIGLLLFFLCVWFFPCLGHSFLFASPPCRKRTTIFVGVLLLFPLSAGLAKNSAKLCESRIPRLSFLTLHRFYFPASLLSVVILFFSQLIFF